MAEHERGGQVASLWPGAGGDEVRTFARRGATFVKTRAAHRDGAWKAQCGFKSATVSDACKVNTIILV